MKGYSLKKVDTTGAGDAFMGALLHSIAQDPSLIEAILCSYISILTKKLARIISQTILLIWVTCVF